MTIDEAINKLNWALDNNTIENVQSAYEYIEAVELAIEALEQESKTGHWIATGDYFTGAYGCIDYVKCSCCGYESLEEGHYCPNCGAKMDKE